MATPPRPTKSQKSSPGAGPGSGGKFNAHMLSKDNQLATVKMIT